LQTISKKSRRLVSKLSSSLVDPSGMRNLLLRLASTGAAGVVTIAGLGLAAVGAGVAAIVVMRRRKQNS